jgi:hypothetical protein
LGSANHCCFRARFPYFAPSALPRIIQFHLGRCPRLSHFAPLALG